MASRTPVKEILKQHLGMFWEVKSKFHVPSAGSAEDAVKIFKKNLVDITWNCLSALERNPASLPQTETILKGQSVSGISIDDLMQVKHFGDGAKMLVKLLTDGSFRLDEKTACALHEYVGKEEALTWGKFRDRLVTIRDVNQYTPPESRFLSEIAEKGFAFLDNEIEQPVERAVATFLFMARNQFFHDANKRTASLMMNGVMLQNSLFPIAVMNRDSEQFHSTLRDFYNSGDATDMLVFFAKAIRSMYPDEIAASYPTSSFQKI
ncbi:MAG: Fic family protein [Desulfovibrio sp.]|jgi:Fic family protein|nr:Fic family protein [Desulfovibrio sp.]